jgi:hypothetical protein
MSDMTHSMRDMPQKYGQNPTFPTKNTLDYQCFRQANQIYKAISLPKMAAFCRAAI